MKGFPLAVPKSVLRTLIDVDFRLFVFRQRPFDGGVRAGRNEFIFRREMQCDRTSGRSGFIEALLQRQAVGGNRSIEGQTRGCEQGKFSSKAESERADLAAASGDFAQRGDRITDIE